jgi:hypothetical protein
MRYKQKCTDEDHLSAIATNAMFLLHYSEGINRGFLPAELNDLPDYSQIPGVHRHQNTNGETVTEDKFLNEQFHKRLQEQRINQDER